ncbi:MAG: hypothetical protein ACI8Y7_000081 [Candidatus Woesearchaeota archaeon]|jgi:hypothetical protein
MKDAINPTKNANTSVNPQDNARVPFNSRKEQIIRPNKHTNVNVSESGTCFILPSIAYVV